MASERELKKIAEGREAEMFAWDDGTILRLLRNPDAAWLNDLQTTALRVAGSSGVRVPAGLGTTTVNGRPGLIMERIDGVDYLTLIGRRPWQVFGAASVCGELHAKLHGVVAPSSLEPLKSRLKRQIETQTKLDESLARLALETLGLAPGTSRWLGRARALGGVRRRRAPRRSSDLVRRARRRPGRCPS